MKSSPLIASSTHKKSLWLHDVILKIEDPLICWPRFSFSDIYFLHVRFPLSHAPAYIYQTRYSLMFSTAIWLKGSLISPQPQNHRILLLILLPKKILGLTLKMPPSAIFNHIYQHTFYNSIVVVATRKKKGIILIIIVKNISLSS